MANKKPIPEEVAAENKRVRKLRFMVELIYAPQFKKAVREVYGFH
jgi:hypothetical protein